MKIALEIIKGFITIRNLALLVLMVGITTTLVLTGVDAWWVGASRAIGVRSVFGLAGMIGFFMPVILWAVLFVIGIVASNPRMRSASWVVATAGIAGWFGSSLLKFFTGRPGLRGGTDLLEWSQTFQFGLGEGGIFHGWPSSHTTVAFAMSVALALHFRDKKWIGIIAIIYAVYIGIGATGFHWLSDVVAGVILGTMIGLGVGKLFQEKNSVHAEPTVSD